MRKLLRIIVGVLWLSCCAYGRAETLHVAPDGNDAWTGRVAHPNADRSDGPLASLQGARDAIRKLKATAALREPLQVLIADGTYSLSETLAFTPQDSGTQQCPIRYVAAEGARPVFSGGRTAKELFQVLFDGIHL